MALARLRSPGALRVICYDLLRPRRLFGAKLQETSINMANHEELNDLLFALHNDVVVNDEELLLLQNGNRPRNPHFQYWNYERFDLDQPEDDECKADFRFCRGYIYTLLDIVNFPEELWCYSKVLYTLLKPSVFS